MTCDAPRAAAELIRLFGEEARMIASRRVALFLRHNQMEEMLCWVEISAWVAEYLRNDIRGDEKSH
ncbi:hypothetical protein LOC54_03335 [Acetobacter sp. AN02]|uniref:hypothetical protein n=1 Tax=Acetobacter sp. AN02 TaxID=2894186 RepID=UPI0024341A66|nr:hypothetical protein [Acetobacter sp. AN02]MDG6094156.1 hypothetical protein [Acetobacter sp. AN02]